MVAVLAGNGLGLTGSSLAQLGAALGGQAGLGPAGSQFVNVATGNLVLQSQDEGLTAQGLLAAVVRTYNSLGTTGQAGAGWSIGLDRHVTLLTGTVNAAGSTVQRDAGDGDEEVFTYDATQGVYTASTKNGAEDQLSWNAGTGTWTYTQGATRQQETYNAQGQLTSFSNAESGATYTLSYNQSGQLVQVTAADGEALELGYNFAGQLSSLSTLQTPAGGGAPVTRSRVNYSYDSSGRLTQVSTLLDPAVSTGTSAFTTTYAYDGTSLRVAQLTESNGTTIAYTYAQGADGVYRVATVTAGTGASAQALSFAYDLANHATTVTDAAGRAWTYAYDTNGNLTSVTSPAVNGQRQVTSYQYTADGHLAQVTDAAGNTTTYQYDAFGNRILEQDAAGNTVAMTYNADDQLLTRTVYLAPASGSTAASQPETTYYVYDSNDQLRFTIDATGDVAETQYNTLGQVSMTRQFAGAAYNVGSLSASTPPALATMTSWAAAQDLTQTTRVDYSYDATGRLTGQEAWDTVDASGNGVLDNGTAITQSVYDSQGLLRQQITLRGSSRSVQETTSYSYDGLGRLLSSTDALGNATTYAYNDAQGQIAVTQANGLIQTKVYNSAGELVTVTLSAAGQTQTATTGYFYDAEGELRAVQNADGGVSYTFYDAAGRVSGTVDATGAVTQVVRDADGRVTSTIAYATRVNTTSWLSGGTVTPTDLTTVLPAASASDRTTLATYDAAGRLATATDAAGTVTTYAYDGASNRIETQVSDAAHSVTHTTRTFYDAAGRTLATLDPAGYLTETVYDAAGRINRTIAYATVTSAALQSTGTLAQLRPATTAQDQVTRTFYDDRGNPVGQLDADGYLTTYTFDSADHQRATQRYALQLTGLTGTETLATLVSKAGPGGYQQTLGTYDADGRLLTQQNPEGTVTQYTYDSVGHLVETQVGVGTSTVRENNQRYDVFGNLIGTLDGVGSVQLTPGMTETQLDALYQQYGTRYTYDALGRRTERIAASGVAGVDGAKTWYFYDAAGRPTYAVHGVADASGNANALGEVQQTTYDAFGDVAQTVRYAGRIATSNLSTLGTALSAIANAQLDATATYTYTARGQVATAQDGVGYLDQYAYDAFGNRIQTTLQVSQPGQATSTTNTTTTTDVYDARGLDLQQTANLGGLNVVTQASYDAFGRVVSTTDARGAVTRYAYDPLGRQISTTRTVQGQVQTSASTYDAYGRVLSQTDALGNTTTYAYNTAARSVTVTSPEGVTLTTVHDAFGDTVSVTDGAGDSTQYAYDLDGRLVSTTDPTGATSTRGYDAVGDLIQTTDATGRAVAYTYDAQGRVLSRIVDPAGLNLTTTYAYDGRGQQVSTTDPTGVVTTTSYDADGNALSVVQDAGSGRLNLTTTYTWDGQGHELTVTEGAGTAAPRTTQYVYDSLGRRIQTIVDPAGLKLATGYAYDGNGNLTQVTDATGNVTRYAYNEANQRIDTIDPMGAVTQAYYDANGHMVATRAYANPLTPTQLSALGSAPTVAQVASDLSPDNTRDALSYQVYDTDGRLRYTINADGAVTETRYNSLGQVAETLAYPTAVSVSSTLQSELLAGTATPADVAAVVTDPTGNARAQLSLYDAAGRLRFVVTQGSLNGAAVGFVTETRYDASGRAVASIVHGTALSAFDPAWTTATVAAQLAGDPNQRLTQYVYDNAGRQRYAIDSAGDVTETRYDADGRVAEMLQYGAPIAIPTTLTEASVGAAVAMAQAASGVPAARLTTNTYDAAGRVIQTGDALGTNALYTYDATGLKTTYTDRDGATWTYGYDAAGRKTQETSPAVTVASYNATTGALQTATQSIVTTYAYDALGNLTSRTVGAGSATPRTIQYVYDADGHQIQTIYPDPGAIDPATGALVPTGSQPTSTVTYNALGLAVVGTDVNGNVSYKLYDAQGQLRYSVDATGHVTGYGYDAYGDQTSVTRYATALNTGAISGWTAGTALTLAQIQEPGVLQSSSADRTLTTAYDLRGNKVTVTQPSVSVTFPDGTTGTGSPTTAYTYDALGNLTSQATQVLPAEGSTPAVWATTYHYYDALGHKVMTVDPMGYVTTWQYDATGDVVSTTQYARAINTQGLSAASKPSLPVPGDATTGYDRTTSYSYDALGRVVEQQALSTYNLADGSPTQGEVTTTTTYDGEGRITSAAVDGVTMQATQYDALGRVIAVTGPQFLGLSNVSGATAFTQLANSTSVDLRSASLYQATSITQAFTYDALGNCLQAVSGDTGATSIDTVQDHYDLLGHVVQETHVEMGQTTYSAYTAAGNLTSSWMTLTGTNGESSQVTTTYTYDADNRQLSTLVTRQTTIGGIAQPTATDSAAYVQYDAFGEITAKGDDGSTWPVRFTYDNAGRQLTATDAKTGAVHTYTYDLAGHQITESVPAPGGGTAVTTSTIDLDGRVVQQILPPNSSAGTPIAINKSYDRWGNVTQVIDGRGYVTQYFYNTQNQLTREVEPITDVVDPSGNHNWVTPEKNWYYDAQGRLIGTRDENGNTNWVTYDAAGHKLSATDGLGNVTLYAYSARGQQVLAQDPDGHITYTRYNTIGQVTQQGDFLPNGAGTARTQSPQETYVLNQDGDRIETTDALGNTTYDDYDSQHRLLKSQTPTQYAANAGDSYTYDVLGNKTGETTALGDHESWSYDYYGRLQAHTDLSGAQYTYTYDPAGSGLLTHQHSNWSAQAQGQIDPAFIGNFATNADDTYTSYYANGQIAEIQTTSGIYKYQYDASGNRTVEDSDTWNGAAQEVHVHTQIVYDSHNRIARVTSDDVIANQRVLDLNYYYDAVGNRRAIIAQSGYGTNVTPINASLQAPSVISAPTGVSLRGGVPVSFTLRPIDIFNDPQEYPLTYSATLPNWLSESYDASTGAMTFSATAGSSAVIGQTFDIQLTATNHPNGPTSIGLSTTTTFTVKVVTDTAPRPAAPPPAGTAQLSFPVKIGESFSAALTSGDYFTDSDVGDSVSVTLRGSLPPGLSIDNSNPSVARIVGTVPSGTAAGTYNLTLTGTDQSGETATQAIQLVVATPQPPTVVANPSESAVAGHDFSWQVPLSSVFTDPQKDAIPIITAKLSNGNALPSWLSFQYLNDQSPAQLSVAGQVPAGALGATYVIDIQATNTDGLSATATLTLTVVQALPPVSVSAPTVIARAGQPLTGASWPVGNLFTDPQGDSLELGVSFPSGSPLAGVYAIGMDSSGNFSITGTTPSTLALGSYPATLWARDTDGLTTNVPITIKVESMNPPVAPAIGTQSLRGGQSGSITLPAFTQSDGDPLTYSVTGLPAGLSLNANSPTISGTPPASLIGQTLSLSVTATDSSMPWPNNSATATFNLQIVPTWQQSDQTFAPNQPISIPITPTTDPDGDGSTLTYTATRAPAGLTFDPSTLTFSGTVSSPGAYPITVTATAPDGNYEELQFNLLIQADSVNFPPPSTNPTWTEGVAGTYPIPAASDADHEALSYSAVQIVNGVAQALPSWLKWTPPTSTSPEVTFSGTAPALGSYTIQVTATAPSGASNAVTFTLTVDQDTVSFNTPATNQTVLPGSTINYVVPAATDAAGATPTYSATWNGGALPSWLTFNPLTRTFGGTAPSSGTYPIVVKAVAPSGASTTTGFNVTVDSHTFSGTNPTWTLGSGVNYTGSFTDPAGLPLTYSAQVYIPAHDAETVGTAGEIIDHTVAAQWVPLSNVGLSINSSTGQITGTASTLDYDDYSTSPIPHFSYQIQITAQDSLGASGSGTITATINYQPTLANPIPAVSLNPGGGSYSIAGNTFSDIYGGLNYSAAQASGAALPANMTLSSTGTLTVGAVAAGTYTLKVTVTDKYFKTNSTDWTVTVNNVAPVLNGTIANVAGNPGSTFSVPEPIATDANGDALTYGVSPSGGGALPSWAMFNASTRTFSGTLPSSGGPWTFVYTVSDGHGGTTSADITVQVQPPNLPPSYNGTIPSWVTRNFGQSYKIPSGAFTDPYGQALTYTAAQSSGAALPAWVTFYPSTQTFATTSAKIERMVDITITATDPQGRTASATFTLDALGNSTNSVSRLSASSTTSPSPPAPLTTSPTTTPNLQQEWFTYDADNRVVIADGQLVSGSIQLSAGGVGIMPSYENSYDAAGHVVSVESLGGTDLMAQRFSYDLRGERTATWYALDLTAGQTDNGIQSTQQYDAAGHLQATVQYFQKGTVYKYYFPADAAWNTVNVSGWLDSAQTTFYDADGRVIGEATFGRPSGQWYKQADWKIQNGTPTVADEKTVPNPLPALGSTTFGQLNLSSETTNQQYDQEGNLIGYSYSLMGTAIFNYAVNYFKRDGYLERSTSGSSNNSSYTPASDTSIYDALGQRIAVKQTEQLPGGTTSALARVFSYDGDGQILTRTDGTVDPTTQAFTALSGSTTANPDAMAPQHYVYAEGHPVASLSEAGTIQTSDGLTPYSDPQSSGTYTVQAGDTLQSIAQTVYGNSNLWYVIADANAISVDSSGNAVNLVAGTTLKLPAVSNSQNSSQTFTPYNPLKLIGSTTPALAYLPPPPSHQCNTLAEILVVAVTALVTYETMGATSGVLESELGATGSLMASAAIGGAVGSAAGQLTGDALGVSTGFSLDRALTQGLANGLTAGLTSGLQTSDLSALEQGGKLTTLGHLVDGAGSYAAGVAAAGIVGEPTQFSWAGMAAAALADAGTARSGLPTNAESSLGPSTAGFAQDLAGRLVNDTLDRELSLALGDTRVQSLRQIGIDAFGNALGDAGVAGIKTWQFDQALQRAATQIVTGVMGSGPGTSTGASGTGPDGGWPGFPYAYTPARSSSSANGGTLSPGLQGSLAQFDEQQQAASANETNQLLAQSLAASQGGAAPLGSYANPLQEAPINVAPSARELWAAKLQDYAQANGLQAPPDNASMSELYQYYDRWQQASGQPNVSLVSVGENGGMSSVPLSGIDGAPLPAQLVTIDLSNVSSTPSGSALMAHTQVGPASVGSTNQPAQIGVMPANNADTALGADSYLGALFAGYSNGMNQLLKAAGTQETKILGVTSDAAHNVGDIATPIFGAYGIMEVIQDAKNGNYRAAYINGGQTVGGIFGSEIGAQAGLLGMLAPPPFDVVATPTLSVSGSIAGGVYGSHLGGAAGNWLYNFITNSRSAPQTQPLQNPNNE